MMNEQKLNIKELRIKQDKKINPDRLHEEIQAALGDKYIGMNTGPEIIIRATEAATAQDAALVEQIVAQHDPAKLSKKQQFSVDCNAARNRLKGITLDDKTKLSDLIPAIADMRTLLLRADEARRMWDND